MTVVTLKNDNVRSKKAYNLTRMDEEDSIIEENYVYVNIVKIIKINQRNNTIPILEIDYNKKLIK